MYVQLPKVVTSILGDLVSASWTSALLISARSLLCSPVDWSIGCITKRSRLQTFESHLCNWSMMAYTRLFHFITKCQTSMRRVPPDTPYRLSAGSTPQYPTSVGSVETNYRPWAGSSIYRHLRNHQFMPVFDLPDPWSLVTCSHDVREAKSMARLPSLPPQEGQMWRRASLPELHTESIWMCLWTI